MKILNGWKEIGEFLNRTPKSAQRWERQGLPVRRVSENARSAVIAFPQDIELWLRKKQVSRDPEGSLGANILAFQSTVRKTQKLLRQLDAAHLAQKQLVREICYRMRGNSAIQSSGPIR